MLSPVHIYVTVSNDAFPCKSDIDSSDWVFQTSDLSVSQCICLYGKSQNCKEVHLAHSKRQDNEQACSRHVHHACRRLLNVNRVNNNENEKLFRASRDRLQPPATLLLILFSVCHIAVMSDVFMPANWS